MHKKHAPLKAGRTRPATFSPYLPQGIIGIEELESLVARMKEAGAKKAKFGGEAIFVWEGEHRPVNPVPAVEANDFKASAVRPVKLCSAETFCQRYHRPVLALARAIDQRFRGRPLPVRMHIGVAGCPRGCSEPAVKDIGVIAHASGYELLVGGSAGLNPMLALSAGVAENEADLLEAIERVLRYVERSGKKTRLGRQLEKIGIERFREEAGLTQLLRRWRETEPA